MSSPPTNSLLNLLNPYASVTASQVPQRDRERKDRGREREQRRSSRSSRNSWGVDDGPGGRESPSAVLLRELQFESGGSASASASAAAAAAPAMARVRSQSQNTSPKSPTPKATPAQTPGISTSASVSASASAAQGKRFGGSSAGPVRPSNLMGDSSSEDDVPASVMFDGGRSTPTRPSAGAGAAAGLAAPGTAERWASSRSPGPFRRQPSSTSSSTQSPTSPTIPLHGLATHIPDVGPAGPASTSTKSDHSPRSTSTEDLPTARPSARPWAVVHEPEEHELYATPLVSPPSGRTRRHGSRKYHALAPAEVNRSDRDRDRGRRKKNGLSGYDKALWQWVNVFNVDSCLQEVSISWAG
jgi:hypothetical protein